MTIQERLDARYGRGRTTGQVVAWVLGGVAVVAFAVWYLWGSLGASAAGVDFDDRGFEVRDAHEVSVSFQVTSTHEATVACALEALDEEFGVVGWRVVELPASDSVTTAYTEVVPTLAEATTGVVSSCWVP